MPEIILTETAHQQVRRVVDSGLSDSVALVLVPDLQTDSIIGRFMDRATLAPLPLRYITHIEGRSLPVYGFGIELPQDGWGYELNTLPLPDLGFRTQDPFTTLLATVFRIRQVPIGNMQPMTVRA